MLYEKIGATRIFQLSQRNGKLPLPQLKQDNHPLITTNAFSLGSRAWMNMCPYGLIYSYVQDFSHDLMITTIRVTSITPSVAVKLVSCTSEILPREGIIQSQWGDLTLRQVLI